jgi:predicted dehydrogenase
VNEPLQAPGLSATRKPRLGFLGLGWIGMNRMRAIAHSGSAEIAAVADTSADVAEGLADAAPNALSLRSLDELLAHDLDAIVIATPSALHAQQACAALERGVAVFCQKPLGRDAAETRRVVEAARRADRLLEVDLSYRYTQAARQIYDLIRAGDLGEVYAVDLVFHNAYGPDKAWFYDKRLSGGGPLIDLGVHLADLALWMLDFPEVRAVRSHLFSRGARYRAHAEEVEDWVQAEIELAGGAVVRLTCSWKAHAGKQCAIEASFYGTHAAATLQNVDGSFYDFTAETMIGTARRTLCAPPDAWGGRAAVRFAQRLAVDRSFDPGAARYVDTARLLDRIYAPENV